MKKIFSVLLVCMCAVMSVRAEVEFTYEAGAELVSSYIWRGQYLGGLSFQPNATVGFENDNVSFQAGFWGSVGASDWGFRKETVITDADGEEIGLGDGTYFVPELDFVANLDFYGVHLGLTHYYYFNGSNYFCWKNQDKWTDEEWENNSSTTEVSVGYNFNLLLPEEHNLYVNWNTTVGGYDFNYDLEDSITRNFSSYLEIGYDYTFTEHDLTLGAQIGMVPWKSYDLYYNDRFAVTNLALKINKAWEVGPVELDLFAQGMLNPYQLRENKESVFVKASGSEKISNQSLNGCIGLGIWF